MGNVDFGGDMAETVRIKLLRRWFRNQWKRDPFTRELMSLYHDRKGVSNEELRVQIMEQEGKWPNL